MSNLIERREKATAAFKQYLDDHGITDHGGNITSLAIEFFWDKALPGPFTHPNVRDAAQTIKEYIEESRPAHLASWRSTLFDMDHILKETAAVTPVKA